MGKRGDGERTAFRSSVESRLSRFIGDLSGIHRGTVCRNPAREEVIGSLGSVDVLRLLIRQTLSSSDNLT